MFLINRVGVESHEDLEEHASVSAHDGVGRLGAVQRGR